MTRPNKKLEKLACELLGLPYKEPNKKTKQRKKEMQASIGNGENVSYQPKPSF